MKLRDIGYAHQVASQDAGDGVLYNPREPATKGELASSEAAALTLKVAFVPIAAQTPGELEAAFRTATAQQLDGLIVLTHGFAVLNGARIIALAAQHRLPVLYGWRILSPTAVSCP